jgi:hypothetical protein
MRRTASTGPRGARRRAAAGVSCDVSPAPDPKDTSHQRQDWSREQASKVDADLRRLARREAEARLALGRLARVFSVRQGHHDLAFVSIGDYTRERLGISSSQFYELSQVATSLTWLPLIEDALAQGTISWTKARELVAVAAPEAQEQWLAVATRCTADQLHALIASARTSATASPPERAGCRGGCSAGCPHDDDIDDEPSVTVVMRCPQAVRLLWWEVLRLSCRVAGSDLAAWQSAEIIAAEGLSESGWPLEPFEGLWTGNQYSTRNVHNAAATDVATIVLPEAYQPGARAQRDHLSRMAVSRESVTAEQLDQSMRAVIATMQRIDADIGRLLCLVADRRLHRQLGCNDFGAYCRNALGMCTRKARALVAIERARRRTCSRITEAYRSGLLSWHRCLVLLPVLTERTADAWIERAQQVAARRLADEVMWSHMACDAGVELETMPPPLHARLDADFGSFVHFRGSFETESAGTGLESAGAEFGSASTGLESALLDAEIRYRAPITVAGMFRSAVFARRRPGEPVWMGLMRLLAHVRTFWMAVPKHHDPIFERDGWRCAVPACSSRRNLHDHHVVFRSHGGGNEPDNRVAVCASHHQHGIHRGVLRASGKAGVGLDWELGRRDASGRPLLCVSGRGEVYTAATSTSEWVRFVRVESSGIRPRARSAPM